MVTLDVVRAVTLVAHSFQETEDEGGSITAESVEFESSISNGSGGDAPIDVYTRGEIDAMMAACVNVGEDGFTINRQLLCLLREAEGNIQRVVLNVPEQGSAYVAIIDNLHRQSVQVFPWCIQFNDGDNYALVGTLKPHEASIRARLEYNSRELAFLSDVSGKEDVTPVVAVASGTTAIVASVNTYYEVAGTVGTLAITLPVPSVTDNVSVVVVHLTTGANPAVTIGSAATVDYSSAYAIDANKEYEINCLFNGDKWIVAGMEVV